MQNRNKMKKSNGAKVRVQIGVFLIAMLFIGASYYLYGCMCYAKDNGLVQELNFDVMIKSTAYFSAPTFSVPLNFATFAEILTLQVTKLWWVYLGFATIIWMSAAGNYGNDYKGVEKGSAEWADKYAKKDFSDDTGIPLGDRFYASIDGKNGAYKPHNLNEIVIGGSGAGKSFRKIKPDIIQMFGSFVVTDPKGL
jgi:hypothetical protein